MAESSRPSFESYYESYKFIGKPVIDPPVADASHRERTYYRSIWISDFHLGTARCKAESLLDFLRSHCADNLFLVGDVIDGWNVGPAWCWDAAQTAVVEELWGWRRRGARMIFIPGNHDEHNSDMIRTLFGEVEFREDLVHRTAEGRRMLITHGHQFDGSPQVGRWIAEMGGSVAYSAMLRLNLWYNRASAGGESRQRAAKARIKRQIKSAVHYLIDFRDEAVTRAALGRKVDGVICGHTHHPDHRMTGPLLYINDGDWVQSRTALVEEADGALKLLRWEKTPTENQNEVDA